MKDKETEPQEDRELMALLGATLRAGEAPTEVVVVPWGKVESSAGSFVVDEESGRAVVEAFTAHGTDLPIDYEHQTLGGNFASPRGTAPAAGWITALRVAPDLGIVASVNWTQEARGMLAAREYRYLSPVAIVRRGDRKLMGLHSVALTNKPAIVGMAALVNGGAKEAAAPANAEVVALREKLSLEEGADFEALLIAAKARIEALEEDSARKDMEEALAAAQAAGKLTSPQRAWALKLALKDRALFEEWLATAPVVVRPGRLEPPSAADGGEPQAARQARSEYRASPMLQGITSEEAYVACAARGAER